MRSSLASGYSSFDSTWPLGSDSCSIGREISTPTLGHACCPQEQRQQGPGAYPGMGAWQEFHMLWVKDGKGEQQPAKLQESRCTDTEHDPNVDESLPGQSLRSDPLGERRPTELTPAGGTASSKGLGMATHVQKAFRGRGPPLRALLGEDPGARGGHAPRQPPLPAAPGQLALPPLPRSPRCVFKSSLLI